MRNKSDKSMFKMTPKELELWIYTKKRGFVKPNKKGKGSYKRNDNNNLRDIGDN